MTETQVIDPADVICGLKAAVTALECYHNIHLLKQQEKQKEEKPSPPPMYMMIPIEEDKNLTKKQRGKRPASGTHLRQSRKPEECTSRENSQIGAKDEHCRTLVGDLKFPEMRSGILYTRCHCVHRDGLQDLCPLSQCQGQDECLVKPWPVCPPAKYLRCRHPELYSTLSDPDSLTC